MATIRSLAVQLGLDVDFGAFAKAGGAIELLRLGLDKVVEGAVGLVEQFAENVKSALEYGDELHDTAQAMGVTTDALQELRYAASLSNMSAEELDSGLRLLSRTMAEAAKGGKEQAGAFGKIGVKVKDANGHLRDAGDVMGDIADHMKSIPDGAEKTALSMQLFGRAGARLIPLLNEGGEGLEAMRQEARDLGLVMGKDSVDAADELGDNLRRLKAVGEGLWRGAIAPLLPAIGDLVKQFLAWRKANAEILRQRLQQFLGAMVATVRGIGKAFSIANHAVKFFGDNWQLTIIAATAALAPFIVELVAAGVAATGTALGVAAAWALAALPFIAIGAAVAALFLVFDDLRVYAKGGDSLFGRFEKNLTEWGKAKGEDPWWLVAIKDFVRVMHEAVGLMDDWQMVVDPAGYAARKAAKSRKQIDAEIATQNIKTARQRVALGLPLTAEEKAALYGSGVKEDEFRKKYGFESSEAARGTAPGAFEASAGGFSKWDVAPPVYASFQPPPPPIVQQSNVFNVTQQPGENSEAFAQRVSEIIEQQRTSEYESTAAAAPASY